jgi:hypothetical protein
VTASVDESSLYALNAYAQAFGTGWFVTRLDRVALHDHWTSAVTLRHKSGVEKRIPPTVNVTSAIAHAVRGGTA